MHDVTVYGIAYTHVWHLCCVLAAFFFAVHVFSKLHKLAVQRTAAGRIIMLVCIRATIFQANDVKKYIPVFDLFGSWWNGPGS